MSPTNIGPWSVMKRLSMGAVSEIFLVRDLEDTGDHRGLKRLLPVLSDQLDLVEAFQREARLCRVFDHPNLVPIHSNDVDGQAPYIVMEFVEGCSLRQLMSTEKGPLPIEVAARIAVDTANGLERLHSLLDEREARLVVAHRDVTPRNIMLRTNGEAVLIDYGLVTGAVAKRMTATDVVKGTWRYAAPEQLQGKEVGAWTDVYSLAAIFSYLATGVRPFSDLSGLDEMLERKTTRPVESGALPEEVQGVIARATSVDPSTRYQDVAEFRDALEAVIAPASHAAVQDSVGARVEAHLALVLAPPGPSQLTSAEERGEEVTNPRTTEDITQVKFAQVNDDSEPGPWLPYLTLALLLTFSVWALVAL